MATPPDFPDDPFRSIVRPTAQPNGQEGVRMFVFRNLSPELRVVMLAEFDSDVTTDRVYPGDRLTAHGRSIWPGLLRDALASSTPEQLAAELNHQRAFETMGYQRHGGKMVPHKTPTNAAEILADGEFNRYYIRSVCLAAIARDGADATVQVYRGKMVRERRPESAALENKFLSASALLADLRENWPKNTMGVPGGPASGLTVQLAALPAVG